MNKGRHAAGANFPRDLAIMLVGIVVVGAVVFGALWVASSLVGGDDDTATSSTAAASTTVVPVTTVSSVDASSSSSTSVAAATTVATITPRPPNQVVVQVLNAVGTTGLAADVTTVLRAQGYDTIAPDDYEPLLDRSQILFRDGFGPEAFELAAIFPDAQVGMSRDIPEGVDLVVLLGSSYEAE